MQYILFTQNVEEQRARAEYADYEDVDFTELMNCYTKFWAECDANASNNLQAKTVALEIRFYRIMMIQLTCLLFTKKLVSADLLYDEALTEDISYIANLCSDLLQSRINYPNLSDWQINKLGILQHNLAALQARVVATKQAACERENSTQLGIFDRKDKTAEDYDPEFPPMQRKTQI